MFLTDLLSNNNNNNSKSNNNNSKGHKSKPTMNKTKKIVMRKNQKNFKTQQLMIHEPKKKERVGVDEPYMDKNQNKQIHEPKQSSVALWW